MNQHKVILVSDSIMGGFDANYFSKLFSVKTVSKRSAAEFRKNLTSSINEITQHAPNFVYIHLGTKDIQENRSVNDILEDLEFIIGEILKQTSQSCQVVISQVISCKSRLNDIHHLQDSVLKLVLSSDKGL